jgi:hypothetical protein
MSRNINDLVPEAILPYMSAKNECKSKGLFVVETCVKRQLIEHVALYAQGRESYYEICRLREIAGLWKIGEAEAARIVTWTFLSCHIPQFALPRDHKNYGKVRGVDFALEYMLEGKLRLHWNVKVDANENNFSDFEEVGAIFEKHGFEWGGRWPTPDRPHVQWPLKV